MKKKTKYYTSIEAIELMLKGKKMCYEGHNWWGGYYYDVSYEAGYEESKIFPQIVEHHGCGAVYKDDVNILYNRLFIDNERFVKKKVWMIAKPKDFGLKKFPATLRKSRYEDDKEEEKSWWKRLFG